MSAAVKLMIASACCFLVLGTANAADSDSKSSREREMLRRTQEALRQTQADNAQLAQSKTQAEQQLKAASDELSSLRSGSKAAQNSLRSQLQTATTGQAEMARQLELTKQELVALKSKQQETAGQLSARDASLKQTQQDLEKIRTANTSCETKNLKLYEYSQDLLARYEHKGVWTAMSHKEPVLGLGQVGMQNVVQEYREKLQSQRLQPAPAPEPASAPAPAPAPAPQPR